MSDVKAVRRAQWTRGQKVILAVAAGVVAITLVSAISPWPSAMLIRWVFTMGAEATVDEMEPFVPETGISEQLDLSYGDEGASTTFDVFTPDEGTDPLPTIVWIHGGAWISGSKADVAPYLRILASHGYTTVGLNYGYGPEAEYPVAVTHSTMRSRTCSTMPRAFVSTRTASSLPATLQVHSWPVSSPCSRRAATTQT